MRKNRTAENAALMEKESMKNETKETEKNLTAAVMPEDSISGGLTKREYFAGLALQGLLANPEIPIGELSNATEAVEYADALITALNK